jgi:hypothetical protein
MYANWDGSNGYQCIAFAYKHVKPKYNYLFRSPNSPELTLRKRGKRANSNASKNSKGDDDKDKDGEKETIDSPESSAGQDETTEEKGARHLKKIREHQIFIGSLLYLRRAMFSGKRRPWLGSHSSLPLLP